MAASKKGGLGRGLDVLFADAKPVSIESKNTTKKEAEDDARGETVRYLSIHDVKPNANQPRKTFDEDKIEDLANSIKANGIIQPIIARKKGRGYEIVAGERRWRAAIKAELTEIPVIVRDLTEEQNMLFAIIENMQREDLNAIEEAEGLNLMMNTYKMTQEQVSRSVGKSRPYIANSIRLLKLPDGVKSEIKDGRLSAAHGRTLAGIEDAALIQKLADKIIKEGLSVRATETMVSGAAQKKKSQRKSTGRDVNLLKVEEELKEALGTKVKIKDINGRGRIEIQYFSRDELERLIELLKS